MHAENGGAIDVIVQQALADGKRRAKISCAYPADYREAGTGRAIALAEMAGAPVYIVHLSCTKRSKSSRSA